MPEIQVSYEELLNFNGRLSYRLIGDRYYIIKNDELFTLYTVIEVNKVEGQDFTNNHKAAADTLEKRYPTRTPDDIPIVTPVKNFSWNSINRVTHDYSDKRTWYYSSIAMTDETCTDTGDHITYDLPEDIIMPHLISDRDLLGTAYNWTVKKNGSTVTNYTVNYANNQISFDSANDGGDAITVTGKKQNGSLYDLTPSPTKYWLVDYIEIQVSVDCTFNDTLSFELILNNASTGNADYPVGKTTFNGAKDFLNKSNYGNSFPKFGELTKNVVILPWNFVTGYKIYPVGMIVDPYKNEFNKLRAKLANNSKMTDCEIATATFYCYERDL